jgi:hypothetical protein
LSKTFRACKSELIKHSGYFKIALSGRWESNNDGHIEIEDEPCLFEVFSRLAYTAQVFSWMPNKDVEWSVEPGHWPVKLLSEEDETSRLDADNFIAPWLHDFLLSDTRSQFTAAVRLSRFHGRRHGKDG